MRLDRQRPPAKLHRRSNQRHPGRGYRVVPHPTWGEIPRGGDGDEFVVDFEIFEPATRTVVFKTNECSIHPATWDFGDGSPTIHIQSYDKIFHVYASDGTYNVVTTCHGQTATAVVTIGTPSGLTVTAITPDPMLINNTNDVVVTGHTFEPGAAVRFWDGSGFMIGIYESEDITPTTITLADVDTTGWTGGTGGVDVWQNDVQSNQFQFQLT